MSTNYHTALSTNYALNAAVWNAPLSQIDTVLTNFIAGTQAANGVQLSGGSLASGSILGDNTTTKGHGLPVMTETERDAIASPATGLMLVNSTTGLVNFYNGSTWQSLTVTGATGALQLIDSGTESNVLQVDIASIPATYNDLILVGHARSRAAVASQLLGIRFNDDTDNAIELNLRYWESASQADIGTEGTPVSSMRMFAPGATQDSEWWSNFMITIPNYARASTSLSGWLYEAHRREAANVFQRQAGVWNYQDATSTIITKLSIFSTTGANVDVLKYKLYGRGIL